MLYNRADRLVRDPKMGGVSNLKFVEMQSPCDDIQALFVPSINYSEPGEEVTFTNQSSNYYYSFWYLDNVLVSTSIHWTYTFTADGHHDIRLEVKDENETCTAVYEFEHHVHSPIHFCGDLELPDQDSSQCPCMTTFDLNENGEMEQKTFYRWRDRWGNKYCNLSVSGNCEDNMPFKNTSVPTPTPTLCDAGYFKLYFYEIEQGGVTYPNQAQKDIICQAFKDFSILLTPVNPNTVVNFQIFSQYDPNTLTLASATSYYEVQSSISNAIIQGNVWKAINTASSDPSLFHGLVNVNWSYDFSTGYNPMDFSTGQLDFYGIMQHEILHALGFASLIASYSGTSYFQQNNLFSSYDEHLINSGVSVITNNGNGNYTFNSLAYNCNELKFLNISALESPVNSMLNGSFYNPSHFDEECSNIQTTLPYSINTFYVMYPTIAYLQSKRMQQEEVSALCKMGYVISGNYGTAILTAGGLPNPNTRPYFSCSATDSGSHFGASDDYFIDIEEFYPNTCDNFYTGPYSINILSNDIFPPNTVIVELTNLQTNLLVDPADLLPNGFSFSPTSSGLHQFSYRLYHLPTQSYSMIAVVSIYVTHCGVYCEYPSLGCNLICNYEMNRDPCLTFHNLPATYNFWGNIVPAWKSVHGSCDFICGNNTIPNTTMNLGGVLRGVTTNGNSMIPFPVTENFGQNITLNPNKKYLASFYFIRGYGMPNELESDIAYNDIDFTLKMEYADQSLLPSNVPWAVGIPTTQSVIYETQWITHADHGVWKQAVNTYLNPLPNGNLIYLGSAQRTSSDLDLLHASYQFDRIELIEDNFTAGPDQYIGCNQSAVLSAPCMEITNLHYAWFVLDNNGNEIGTPIALNSDAVVSPTVTTSYRLKRFIANINEPGNNGYFVENANSLYAEDDVTVFVQLPSGTCEYSIETNPNNCAIQFTSNNPYGTHLWDFGDGTTSTEVNPSHVFPTNGSYTVSHTIIEFGCVCSYSEVIEVCCVVTPIFNIANQLCQNVNIILPTTSTNGISGTWSPVFSSSSLGTTTYTFTPTEPCYQTPTMTVTIVTCGDCANAPGLQLSGEISGILAPGEYRIVGDIDINNNASFINCVFAVDPNKTITVHGDNPGNELMVFNTHFYGCHALWNGIDVKENGRLRMTSSLIEDAKVAINMQTISQQVTLGNRLIAGDVIFNKNLTGIKINGYPFSNPNQVFILSNNVFTSRVITTNPTAWPNASIVNSANPSANDLNFQNPRINPNLYPNANLLSTLNISGSIQSNAAQTTTGIAFYNVGLSNVNILTNVNEFNSFVIGGNGAVELFDRLTRGIYAFRTNLEVRHAYFQATNHTFGNTGIIADGASVNSGVFQGRILVDGQLFPVHFYNLKDAIDVKDYTRMVVRNTRIRSSRALNSNPNLGEAGIKYYSLWTHQLSVSSNQITNINNGVFVQLGRISSSAISNLVMLDFDVSNNFIRRSIPNGSSGIVYNTGVQVSLTPGSANGFMVTNQNPFKIRNNKISDVRRGIQVSGIAASNIRIEGNEVTVSENIGTAWNSNASFWGVFLRGVTSYNAAQLGNFSTVKDNLVIGFNSVNTQAKGVVVNNSTDFTIQCNNTRIIGAGLYFSGISPSKVRQNNMYLNRYGFWLDNGANIGAQGSVGFPAENTWENGGSNNTNWSLYTGLTPIDLNIRLKTYVSNATAIGQPMYVRNLASHNPDNSWGRNDILWIPINSSFNTLIQTNGNWPKSCLATYLEEPEEIDLEEVFAFNEKLLALESMSVQLDTSQLEAPWDIINEHETYEEIKRNPELRDSSEVLDNYYVQRETENLGKLREAEDKIDEKDYVAAAAIRDGIVPDNLIELAHRSVISLTLKYEMGDFQTSDSLDLVDWAESCGYIYGVAVSKAQILYNYIYRSTEIFNEICPETVPRSVLIASGDKKEVTLSLYPNPTGGMLYIQCSDPELRQGICEIYSLDGRVVYKGNIHFLRGLNLENLNLSSGAYVIEIEVPNKSLFFKEKFIYNK